ncbi:MAG: hypothetical protein K2F62_04540, partial [Muribaculaceae bacterium]|nr:hypothetical protein [Muribaculaceae bacterium]
SISSLNVNDITGITATDKTEFYHKKKVPRPLHWPENRTIRNERGERVVCTYSPSTRSTA